MPFSSSLISSILVQCVSVLYWIKIIRLMLVSIGRPISSLVYYEQRTSSKYGEIMWLLEKTRYDHIAFKVEVLLLTNHLFSFGGARCSSLVEHPPVVPWVFRSLPHSGPIELFLVIAVLHDWCNKGHGMCYSICAMVHIKEHLLLIRKSSPCGGSGFPLSLFEWSFTISPTPYNRK